MLKKLSIFGLLATVLVFGWTITTPIKPSGNQSRLTTLLGQNAGTGLITPLQGLPSGIQPKPAIGAASTTGATLFTVINPGTATGPGPLFLYVTQAQCVNTSAVALAVQLMSNNTGSPTAIWTLPCPVSGAYTVPVPFNPPLRLGTANPTVIAGLGAQATAAGTTVYVSATGYFSTR